MFITIEILSPPVSVFAIKNLALSLSLFPCCFCCRGTSLHHHFADGAKHLIAHSRAAFLVQQVKMDGVNFNGGMDIDRNADTTEGEYIGADRPSHIESRLTGAD